LCLRQKSTEQERRWAEARMMEGFQSMVATYDEQKRQLERREPWVATSKKSGIPPSVMTVTHVNQTKHLYVCRVIRDSKGSRDSTQNRNTHQSVSQSNNQSINSMFKCGKKLTESQFSLTRILN